MVININNLRSELIGLAQSHKCQYADSLIDSEEPCFTYMKCNVPLLADVRMLAEKYGISPDYIESSDSWGYIGLILPERGCYYYEHNESDEN